MASARPSYVLSIARLLKLVFSANSPFTTAQFRRCGQKSATAPRGMEAMRRINALYQRY